MEGKKIIGGKQERIKEKGREGRERGGERDIEKEK